PRRGDRTPAAAMGGQLTARATARSEPRGALRLARCAAAMMSTDMVCIVLHGPASEDAELARAMPPLEQTVYGTIVQLAGRSRALQTTVGELADETGLRVASIAGALVSLREHTWQSRDTSPARYPAHGCGRPLYPHEGGGVCCVGCGCLVDVLDDAIALARAAAALDGLRPLRGDFRPADTPPEAP